MCPFHEVPDGFSPEMLELLDRTFSATWRELLVDVSPSTCQTEKEGARAAVAKSMIDLAATGVREPERLKRHGLHAGKQAVVRTRAATETSD